ncbi:MAG: Uma2 family endonuclease [Saprospiraceae bacterium]
MTAIQAQRITWKRFLEMDFPENDVIYELIDGIIMQRSSPNPIHQRVVRKISALFEKVVKSHQSGEFFPAPLDVFLGEFTCIQPDLVFVLEQHRSIIHETRGIVGAPDLVVEVLSTGTAKRDRLEKKELYQQFGVQEYWIVDPLLRTLEMYTLVEGRYTLHAFLENDETAQSAVLGGMICALDDLFS